MNILCLGGLTTGVAVAWNCAKGFLGAKFRGAERHRRRLAKVSAIRTNPSTVTTFQLVPSPEASVQFQGNGKAEGIGDSNDVA